MTNSELQKYVYEVMQNYNLTPIENRVQASYEIANNLELQTREKGKFWKFLGKIANVVLPVIIDKKFKK